MMEADQNGDGKLDFEEFKAMVANTDIAKQMVRRLLEFRSHPSAELAADFLSLAFRRLSKVSHSPRPRHCGTY